MAVLKKLTEYSYIMETDSGEKMGILIDHKLGSTEKTNIEFFSKDGMLSFNSLSEFEELIGNTITYKEIIEPEKQYDKFIDEYPVNSTDNIYDVSFDERYNMNTFSKSKRSSKRFFPGWWLIMQDTGEFSPRCTISLDIYNQRELNSEIFGPFKTFMEITHVQKSLGK